LHSSFRAPIRAVVYTLLIFGWLAPSIGLAEEEEPGPVWTPPKSDKWDWIHLNSGEWLKGEIKYMRDRKIRFDSDELDDLDIDLADCRDVYMQRLSFLRIESGETPEGRGVLRGDLLEFETLDGKKLEIARDDIISIVPGGGTRAGLLVPRTRGQLLNAGWEYRSGRSLRSRGHLPPDCDVALFERLSWHLRLAGW